MSSASKGKRGRSAAFLRELRRKHGLGEFGTGQRRGVKRAKTRKRAVRIEPLPFIPGFI